MSELPRSDQDKAFAHMLAEDYRGRFLNVDQVQGFGLSANGSAATLLASLEQQVSGYSGSPPSFLTPYLRRLLEYEIVLARRLFAAAEIHAMHHPDALSKFETAPGRARLLLISFYQLADHRRLREQDSWDYSLARTPSDGILANREGLE